MNGDLDEVLKNKPIGFTIIQINKLTIKNYSSLSNINIHYYSKFLKPIRHRQFFKILSQKPEYVKTHCHDKNNPFNSACRKWYLDNQSS